MIEAGRATRNMKRSLASLIVPLALCGAAAGAHGQAVYKCQSQGKTVYSQEPCPGAVTVNTKPAAGAAPSRGQDPAHQGDDKRRRAQALMLTEADLPEVRQERRARLPPGLLSECQRLDAEVRVYIGNLQDAKGHIVGTPSDAHVENRRRYREIGC